MNDHSSSSFSSRMSCQQFRQNLEGAVTLSEEDAVELYQQVLRCEMVEGSKVVGNMNKTVWLCRQRVGCFC